MDLASLKTTDRTIEILHPGTKEPLGVRVTIMHADDERLKKVKRQMTDKRLTAAQKGRPIKSDEVEENQNFLCILGNGWLAVV